jgi:predicted dehydrogenase
MPENLKWGIIGTGKMSTLFTRCLAGAKHASLYGVASRTKEKAAKFAAEFNAPNFCGSYAELIKDPNVDVIYVGTPHTLHRDSVLGALANGKHVLCEKPMGVSLMECNEMIAMAQKTGKVLLEAFMYRVHPQTIKLREVLDNERIGDIRTIRSAFCYGLFSDSYNVRLDKDLRGGGLYDVGCYCINFSRLVAGAEPTRVEALWQVGEESGVDETLNCIMQFPSGSLALFDIGIRSTGNSYAEIIGSKGRIIIPNPWKPHPAKSSFYVYAEDKNEEVVINNGGNIYSLEADHLAEVVAGEAEPLITAKDAMNNAIVLEQIWKRIHGA